jgi:hypothetical protein
LAAGNFRDAPGVPDDGSPYVAIRFARAKSTGPDPDSWRRQAFGQMGQMGQIIEISETAGAAELSRQD